MCVCSCIERLGDVLRKRFNGEWSYRLADAQDAVRVRRWRHRSADVGCASRPEMNAHEYQLHGGQHTRMMRYTDDVASVWRIVMSTGNRPLPTSLSIPAVSNDSQPNLCFALVFVNNDVWYAASEFVRILCIAFFNRLVLRVFYVNCTPARCLQLLAADSASCDDHYRSW